MALGDSMRAARCGHKKQGEVGLLLRGLSENRLFSHSYRGRLVWKYPALFIIHTAMGGTQRKPFKRKKKKESLARFHRKKGRRCELGVLFIIRRFFPLRYCNVYSPLTDLQYVVHPATLQQSDTP